MNKALRTWLLFGIRTAAFATLLKLILGFNFVDTTIVISGWVLIGHVISIDDDFPGGFSNPFGTKKFPWSELLLKALMFGGLLALKFVPDPR